MEKLLEISFWSRISSLNNTQVSKIKVKEAPEAFCFFYCLTLLDLVSNNIFFICAACVEYAMLLPSRPWFKSSQSPMNFSYVNSNTQWFINNHNLKYDFCRTKYILTFIVKPFSRNTFYIHFILTVFSYKNYSFKDFL